MDIGGVIDIQRCLPESATLKPGDLLTVKVIEVFENRRALVDLGRFRALADISFPVAAGDVMRVRVQETCGQLRLHRQASLSDLAPSVAPSIGPVLAAAAEDLQNLRTWIDRIDRALQRRPNEPPPIEYRQVRDALRFFLEPLDPCSSPEAIARRLREFCENCGLFLESRLAAAVQRPAGGTGEPVVPGNGSTHTLERLLSSDLKSLLLLLKRFFAGTSSWPSIQDQREIVGSAAAVAELLADIRAGQEQMAMADAQTTPVQTVHFGLPLAGGHGRAELKIIYGRRSAADREEGQRAAILLELDRMGTVRCDLTLQSARLSIAVFVANTGLRDMVQRHAPEVCEALAPFFDHVAFQVSVSERKIASFVKEDRRSSGGTQVDVIV
jgi:hypothetical protein